MKTLTARFGSPRSAVSGENPTYTLALAVQEAFEVLSHPQKNTEARQIEVECCRQCETAGRVASQARRMAS